MTLTNSTLSGNSLTVYNGDGGCILRHHAMLTNSTVSGNSTAGDGAEAAGSLGISLIAWPQQHHRGQYDVGSTGPDISGPS